MRVPSAIVRDTSVGRPADDLAAPQRLRASAASSGSTPIDPDRRPERLDRGRDPARQPAAADRHEDGREVRQVLDDLEPDRALARR